MAITFTWSVNDMHKVTATGAVFRGDDTDDGKGNARTINKIRCGSCSY